MGILVEWQSRKIINLYIEIAAALNKYDCRDNKDYKFLLIGDGPLRTSIETDIFDRCIYRSSKDRDRVYRFAVMTKKL